LYFARKSRRHSEAGKSYFTTCSIVQDIGGFDVLVDKALPMHPGKSCRDADSKMQETLHIHRLAEDSAQQLASRILENQNGPALIPQNLQRPRGPRTVQHIL
jgi:hypothetical protein